jgi:hypothetical protein
MMFRGINTTYPLHPVIYRADTKQKGDNTGQRAEHPGRFAKEESAKYFCFAHQCAHSRHKECAE